MGWRQPFGRERRRSVGRHLLFTEDYGFLQFFESHGLLRVVGLSGALRGRPSRVWASDKRACVVVVAESWRGSTVDGAERMVCIAGWVRPV